jgi:hypothetical protein
MNVRFILVLSALSALLMSCGTPPSGEPGPGNDSIYMTEQEAAERVQAIKNDVVAVANGFMDGVLAEAAVGVPTVTDLDSVPILSTPVFTGFYVLMTMPGAHTPVLATGTFQYDATSASWSYDPVPSTALVVNWTSMATAAQVMELRIDWTGLTDVVLPGGSTLSVPSGAAVVLDRDATSIIDVDVMQSWRPCAGGPIAEPTLIQMSGVLGDGAARATLRDLRYDASGLEDATLTGGIDVRSGSLELSFDVDLSVEVDHDRGSDCWPTTWRAASLMGGLTLSGPGPTAQLSAVVEAALSADETGMDLSVRNGRFIVDGKRVDFVATVPHDTMADPASLVFLTFADGVVDTLIGFVDRFSLLE